MGCDDKLATLQAIAIQISSNVSSPIDPSIQSYHKPFKDHI